MHVLMKKVNIVNSQSNFHSKKAVAFSMRIYVKKTNTVNEMKSAQTA